MLAEGGIVTQATLAMIGEGGEPEAIIPLSKLASMGFGGGGGNTITVNVTSANPNDVVAALQKWVRNNGQLALASTSGVRF
jgi:SLT domain-containing protein